MNMRDTLSFRHQRYEPAEGFIEFVDGDEREFIALALIWRARLYESILYRSPGTPRWTEGSPPIEDYLKRGYEAETRPVLHIELRDGKERFVSGPGALLLADALEERYTAIILERHSEARRVAPPSGPSGPAASRDTTYDAPDSAPH